MMKTKDDILITDKVTLGVVELTTLLVRFSEQIVDLLVQAPQNITGSNVTELAMAHVTEIYLKKQNEKETRN